MLKTDISKYFIVLLLFVLTVTTTKAQKFSPSSYIAEYKEVAQQLMEETGVPASVILAIAIHESAYGNSRIAKHLNNHFGIKGSNRSKKIRSAYKGYSSVRESYLDFIDLLQRRKSTSTLFDEATEQDYKKWVRGIARSGYSRTGDWSSKVLSTIDRYNLDDYDQPLMPNTIPGKSMLAQNSVAQEDLLLKEMLKNKPVNKFDVADMLTKKLNNAAEGLTRKGKLASDKLPTGQRSLL
ncbi:glucosaminidase domain-containing protein [Sphingobacterium sp. MYb382]|uniref:glucosaminidase domain-containing protein n=1 Tax=Sphingobacterium sp. MYb382 TaxID=2745278 RepID=UPI00309B8C28